MGMLSLLGHQYAYAEDVAKINYPEMRIPPLTRLSWNRGILTLTTQVWQLPASLLLSSGAKGQVQ